MPTAPRPLPSLGIVAFAIIVLGASSAMAAPPTKEECVAAHAEGQDAREAGQLLRAGKLFLSCAAEACPSLVQSDCARFADELARLQPTVTFAARDGADHDLPDTQVHVDGALVAARLGDGKALEIDPGRHEVRFVHAGKEISMEVVVNQGEKGRNVVGLFPSPPAPSPLSPPAPARAPAISLGAPPPAAPELARPTGLLVLTGLGAATLVAGGVITGVGLGKMPAPCSLSTRQCKAPPGDPVFEQAAGAVRMVNVGFITGGAGAAVLAGSLIGYFLQAPRPRSSALAPWIGPGTAGLVFSGAL